MEQLNGTFLFDSMYAEDMEGSKLSNLPGVGELLETYPSGSRPPHRAWAWESRGSPFPLWAPGRCTQGGEDQVRTHGVSGQQGPGCWGWSLAVHGFLLCASYPVFTTVSPHGVGAVPDPGLQLGRPSLQKETCCTVRGCGLGLIPSPRGCD